jgi:hypothetical protein
MGKTPLLPQTVYDSPPYCGSGLFIPYYPLTVEKTLYLSKTDLQAKKRVEVQKNGVLISNSTKSWAQEPIAVGNIMQSNGYGLYTFTVKTETSLNYTSRNIARYVINYTTSNTDLIPPSITRIDCNPCFTDSGYPVTVQIKDNYGISNVSLSYSLDENSWTQIALNNLGQGNYSANIAIPVNAQEISLTVEAYDNSGNSIWFRAHPVATTGYRTQLNASFDADSISGKLSVLDGQLVQRVFLKVKSADGQITYTLTNDQGDFGFNVPQSTIFPLVIEMGYMGEYGASMCTVDKPPTHNIRIISLDSPKVVAGSKNVHVNLTLANQGTYAEDCNVTVCANITSVGSLAVTVAGGDSMNVALTWNTAGFVRGNYSMSAIITTRTDGTNVSEYRFVGGWLFLTFLGDVTSATIGTPDGKVDLRDIAYLVQLYNTTPNSPKWDPKADLNEDLRVDMKDIAITVLNYGKIVR